MLGRRPTAVFDLLPMFKAPLLGSWYGLWGPGRGEALLGRVSFLRFYGLALDASTPDESTPPP